jgi:hypothetical protein
MATALSDDRAFSIGRVESIKKLKTGSQWNSELLFNLFVAKSSKIMC